MTLTGLGVIILDTIPVEHEHDVVIFPRTTVGPLTTKSMEVSQVDYTSHTAHTNALSGSFSIISAISGFDLNSVKQFATSEIVLSTYDYPDLYAGEAAVWEALKVSELQYTTLSRGICMTTLGTDTPTRVAGALAGLRPL